MPQRSSSRPDIIRLQNLETARQELAMDMPAIYPQSAQDWQPYYSIIVRLYRDENKSLKEVQHVLETKYKFKATEKMYKRKINEWGLDKKLKEHEVLEIDRLHALRASAGKRSKFILRGQVVDMDNINRYLKRNRKRLQVQGHSWAGEHDGSFEVDAQMSDLVCRTPSPSPLPADPGTILDENETFYLEFHQYMLGNVEAQIWISRNGMLRVNDPSPTDEKFQDFQNTILRGRDAMKAGRQRQAMWHFRIAFTQVEKVIRSRNYYQLRNFMYGIQRLIEVDSNIANLVMKHVAALVNTLPQPENRPQRLFQSLSKVSLVALKGLEYFANKCALSIFQSHFLGDEDLILFFQAQLARSEAMKGSWTFSPLLVERIEVQLRSMQWKNAAFQESLGQITVALLYVQRYDEAESLCQLQIEKLQRLPEDSDSARRLFGAWYLIGVIQNQAGKLQEARSSLRSAVDAYEKLIQYDCDMNRAREDGMMQTLLSYLIKSELSMGLQKEADEHTTQLEVLQATLENEARQSLIEQGLRDV